jgi:hypothetical protein
MDRDPRAHAAWPSDRLSCCVRSDRLLSEIYGWFTEGLDTIDLKEAALLLRPNDVG